MQNIKSLFKFVILSLGFLIFTNCHNDDLNQLPENKKHESEFKASFIKTSKILSNKKLQRKLENISTRIKEKHSTQNKIVYSSEYDFYINTDYATYIENADESYHSYTFPISRSIETDSIELSAIITSRRNI